MTLKTKKTQQELLVFLSSLLVSCFSVMDRPSAVNILPHGLDLDSALVEGNYVWIPSNLDTIMLPEGSGTETEGLWAPMSKRARQTEGMWRPMKKRGRETEGMWGPMKKRARQTEGMWRPMKRGRETEGMWRPLKRRETEGMWRPLKKRDRETEGMWVPIGKRGRETEGYWGPMGKRYRDEMKDTYGQSWNFNRIVRAWNRVYKRQNNRLVHSGWDPRGKRSECSQCVNPGSDYLVYPVIETDGDAEV